jgi:hypothetical protein
MKFLKQHIIFGLLVFILAILPSLLQAQPVDPCPDPADPDCPIDSGVIVLIVGVLVIAAAKTVNYKKLSSI